MVNHPLQFSRFLAFSYGSDGRRRSENATCDANLFENGEKDQDQTKTDTCTCGRSIILGLGAIDVKLLCDPTLIYFQIVANSYMAEQKNKLLSGQLKIRNIIVS